MDFSVLPKKNIVSIGVPRRVHQKTHRGLPSQIHYILKSIHQLKIELKKKKWIATVEFLIEFNDLIKLIRILHSCESAFRLISLIFNRQCKCKLVCNVTYKWISKWMSTLKTTLMANQLLQLTFCAELKCKLFNCISITVIMFAYYRYQLLLYDMQFSRKFRKP